MKKPNKKTAKKSSKRKSPVVKAKPKKAAPSHGMHDAREMVKERRYEVRLMATQVTFAAVSFKHEGFGKPGFAFAAQLSGLLVDSSAGGCSLVFMQANPLAAQVVQGAECVILIAPNEPRLATIRWVKILDQRLVNAGFEFK